MKQILQNLRTGETSVTEVPCPTLRPGHLLIRSTYSLVSAGTERMLVDFGKASLLEKAWQQPDRVKEVLQKARTDGLLATMEAVFNKLDQPLPLGYCNVGTAIAIGAEVGEFAAGDRIVSNGYHAEVVTVPKNLCARVPDSVTDDEAAFTVIAAIALQGIRLAQLTLGECVVVTGLGLIGLVTVQLLHAHGCRVLGIDVDSSRLALARQLGAETVDTSAGEDPIAAARRFSRGRGIDAVLITASTESSEPVHQAALMSRKRGRIVLVGVAGLELSRADFFEKELSFHVSCSYGPGRYDPIYEQQGIDYPIGFVRWTEQRNFEAVLDMMADRRLVMQPLISHRFAVGDATTAYALIGGTSPSLGILLEYPCERIQSDSALRRAVVTIGREKHCGNERSNLTVIGSGNYATAVLIPAFRAAGAQLRTIVSQNGVSGVHAGRKFGFEQASTDAGAVFADVATDAVVIATRHDSHSRFAVQALDSGKSVFVEKPLAVTLAQVSDVERAYLAARARGATPILMVGFNRRFSPHAQKMRSLLKSISEPKVLLMTVNAGAVPITHWTQDRQIGGGRIIGEGCHFVDLLRFLVGAPIIGFDAKCLGRTPGIAVTEDKATISLQFADGSLGTIVYVANGHKSFPKERLDVFAGGGVLQLDNFRLLTGYGWPRFSKLRLLRQDKGQRACAKAFVDAVANGSAAPIPLEEILEVSRLIIQVSQALR